MAMRKAKRKVKLESFVGKEISALKVNDYVERLEITFKDGSELVVQGHSTGTIDLYATEQVQVEVEV